VHLYFDSRQPKSERVLAQGIELQVTAEKKVTEEEKLVVIWSLLSCETMIARFIRGLALHPAPVMGPGAPEKKIPRPQPGFLGP